jgi:hypothetical protein
MITTICISILAALVGILGVRTFALRQALLNLMLHMKNLDANVRSVRSLIESAPLADAIARPRWTQKKRQPKK